MAPIKTLLWSPWGSGTHYSGPGSFAYRLYSSAAPDRFRLTLAHGYPDQPQLSLFERQVMVAPFGMRKLAFWPFLRASRKWIKSNAGSFDIFHGLSCFHVTMAPAYEAEKNGLPAVLFATMQGSELADKGGWKDLLGLPRRRREMIKRISGVIAMSTAIYESLRDGGVSESKIARIPMAVDINRFHPVHDDASRAETRERLGWRDLPTVVFVGAICKRKQPHLLIDAIHLAVQRGCDCQLALVGPESEPSYSQAMRERCRELGLEARVQWAGFTEDIADAYQAADVFSLPSAREGMSAAIVEAMSSGLPCVVTPISGSVDLVADGVHGRVVPDRPAFIAEALIEFLGSAGRRATAGDASREKVIREYSAAAVVTSYEKLFRDILAGNA